MAKTTYVTIPAGQEEIFDKNLQPGDRFISARLRVKKTIFSRKRKQGITQKSLLPQIGDLWFGLGGGTTAELGQCEIANFSFGDEIGNILQQAWSDAGAQCALNGWRLFVRDNCYRIKNDIAGLATPVLLHQDLVGNLKIESPADEIKIAQYHPAFYWVNHKVYGKKGMYVPEKVTEKFTLPLQISLNYKSNLIDLSNSYTLGYNVPDIETELQEIWFSKVICAGSGHITSLNCPMLGSQEGNIEQGRFAIYSDNAGHPGTLLALSDIFNIPIEFNGVMTANIDCDVVNGIIYWFAIQSTEPVEFLDYIYVESSETQDSATATNTGLDLWPDNPTITHRYWKFSIYAIYSDNPSFAKMYAEVWSSYQGRDILTNLEIDLDYSTDWKNATATLSSVIGYVVQYNLFIHLHNLRGDLFVDNIKAIHNAQNWVRDPYCRDINQAFTRAFYQIPKHWSAEILEDGASFESIYPAD